MDSTVEPRERSPIVHQAPDGTRTVVERARGPALTTPRQRREMLAVDSVVVRLHEQFSSISVDEIVRVVVECHAQFAECRIRTYVPVLVEHAARERLLAVTRARVRRATQSRTLPKTGQFRRAFADGRAWVIL